MWTNIMTLYNYVLAGDVFAIVEVWELLNIVCHTSYEHIIYEAYCLLFTWFATQPGIATTQSTRRPTHCFNNAVNSDEVMLWHRGPSTEDVMSRRV